MKLYVLTFLGLFAGATQAQTALIRSHIETTFKETTDKPQVLLLGLFHFAGEQLDASTTPNNLRVDMMSPARQRQIQALISQLAKFKPTKIAVEASPRSKPYIDSVYRAYCAGQFFGDKRVKASDELYQLAFPLAKRLGLTELFPVDAQPFRIHFDPADSLVVYSKYEGQQDSTLADWDERYTRYALQQDSLKYGSTLNQFLTFLNADKTQARSIGRWLVPTKRGTNLEPVGADRFISRYYNRNIRIFSNVQRIVSNPTDRILVLYGNTHMYLLKHLFQASPEFTLIPVLPYLKD
ncbi:DUF5694 domain-containing protein [Spirosoma koreense]